MNNCHVFYRKVYDDITKAKDDRFYTFIIDSITIKSIFTTLKQEGWELVLCEDPDCVKCNPN
jgi:hypothetical protein